MITRRVEELLKRGHVAYDVVPHRETFTAHEAAEAAHVPEHQIAKVVVVQDTRGRDYVAILPASRHVDLEALGRYTKHAPLVLARKEHLTFVFPDCEVGATPPFGQLYGVPVYVDRCFRPGQDVFFQAGSRHELVRMSWREFERLLRADRAEFCAAA
jgi:Ala-tRNA(Pro) deacylase